MKYRTGFVTNSSSVSFYVGRKGEKRLTEDDVFAMLKECWNDYYDCAERLINHILDSESEEVRELVCVGTEREIWGDNLGYVDEELAWLAEHQIYVDFVYRPEKKELLEALEKQFGISHDEMEILIPYDLENHRLVRKAWLAAETFEEAVKLGIDEDDVRIFVLENCNLDGERPMDFDLQQGLDNLDLLGVINVNKECDFCQVIVETWDSNIPLAVYNRMKARSIGAVYHGC